jgi:hypothetical protein
MQSEALAYAYRVWRREWRGEGKEYVCPLIRTILGIDQHRTEAHLFGKSTTVGQSHRAQLLIIMCAVVSFPLTAALRFPNSSAPSLLTLQ